MIQPTWYPNEGQLRQFAGVSLVEFGLIGLTVRMSFEAEALSVGLWSAGVLICLFGLLRPTLVQPVYNAI